MHMNKKNYISTNNRLKSRQDTQILQVSRQVKSLHKNLQRYSKVRTEQSYQKSKSPSIDLLKSKQVSRKDLTQSTQLKNNQYNKWYIKPKFRYVHKQQNPKKNYRAYKDEEYLYRNLHNDSFWNWIHPFEQHQTIGFENSKENIKNKVNIKILVDFKKKLDEQKIRLPIIVTQLLTKN